MKIFLTFSMFILISTICYGANLKNEVRVDEDSVKTVNDQYILHEVKDGEWLHAIARNYKVSVSDLKKFNPGKWDKLYVGEVLKISLKTKPESKPDVKEKVFKIPEDKIPIYHKVEENQKLEDIAKLYAVSTEEILQFNELTEKDIEVGQSLIVSLLAKKGKEKRKTIEDLDAKVNPEKVANIINNAEVMLEDLKTKNDEVDARPNKVIKVYKEVKEEGLATFASNIHFKAGKSYALHKTLPKGTIVKVKNKQTDKYTFVKIVGQLPEEEKYANMLLVISSKAINRINAKRFERFEIEIEYGVEETN